MADLFKQYGIKEVADVTIYKIGADGTETPFLFLDTLKVSTLEQTAEQSDARGGKGNPKLITWDYGKEVNVTLEDALYSPASMALMWGGDNNIWKSSTTTINKVFNYVADSTTKPQSITDGNGKVWTVIKLYEVNASGARVEATSLTKGELYIAECSATGLTKKSLTINADDFPGTYKVVGDTYARNRDTGEDEYFQFVIPRAKMSADQTLTLSAEGDPTTFNLNLTVLRPTTGHMIELVQYTFPTAEE